MAIRHECDRCGEGIVRYNEQRNTFPLPSRILIVTDTKTTDVGVPKTNIDLCNPCMGLLREWLGLDIMDRENT